LDQKLSGIIGVLGGGLDIIVGALLLQQSMNSGSLAMMGSWLAFFLLILGLIVLTSGMYLFGAPSMMNRVAFGRLMMLYGIIMLLLGLGMITGIIPIMMMQASIASGGLMIVSGLAMLYSGFGMRKM